MSEYTKVNYTCIHVQNMPACILKAYVYMCIVTVMSRGTYLRNGKRFHDINTKT